MSLPTYKALYKGLNEFHFYPELDLALLGKLMTVT